MDDMWSMEAWDSMRKFFPDNNNGSRVVVTTRLSSLGHGLNKNDYSLKMRCLDEVSSWILFSKTVFGEGISCPLELEEIGMKIVHNCKGLPLSIVVIGGLLERLEQTQECWEYIREHLSSVVNLVDNDYCFKILKLSYNHLPLHLKPCFLYLGVFEEDSTLIKLWVAEGFLKPASGKSLETVAKECLKEMVDRNLVQVREFGSNGNIKSCSVHDLVRDLCLREAHKQGFYHILGQHRMKQHRRIVVSKLVGHDLESMSHARSFICDDNNEVQSFLSFRLLRILQAYDRVIMRNKSYISFSTKSPKLKLGKKECFLLQDVANLVNLRYFVVGQDPMLGFPSSFSLLWNLQTLVVAFSEAVAAPVEIWKMAQLRHVHFKLKGVYLPDPPADVVVMQNLQTLKVVRNLKLSEDVVERIPNVEKLSVVIKGSSSTSDHYYPCSNLERLHRLESLYLYCDEEIPSGHLTFPHSLKKLTLLVSGSFQWEEALEEMGSLPFLQKLVLEGGCFVTRTWETIEGHFQSLRFLEMKDCHGLENWVMEESSHFPVLEKLSLHSFTELKEIPTEIGEIPTLRSITLDFCSESAVKSAKKIVEEQEELQGDDQLSFAVGVTVEDDELKSLETPNFKVETVVYLAIPLPEVDDSRA